jgi:hypothetical protein
MNPRRFRRSLVFAALAVSLACGPLLAAEAGLRQQPLQPASGSRDRAPPDPAQRRPDTTSITVKGTRYVVTDGQWYVKRGEDLVAVAPPAGAMVTELPAGYSMRWIGGVPYFYADGVYYVWRERSQRYEIMQNPPAESPPAREPKTDAGRPHAPAP